jgi:hypothetical protein
MVRNNNSTFGWDSMQAQMSRGILRGRSIPFSAYAYSMMAGFERVLWSRYPGILAMRLPELKVAKCKLSLTLGFF